MAMIGRMALASMAFGFALLATGPAWADDSAGPSATAVPPAAGGSTGNRLSAPTSATTPGVGAPLVGLEGNGLALAPPGSASAARNAGLAGSGDTSVDLSYIPPAERDSYLNSKDFADHMNAFPRPARHPSALSQIGGVAEGMAINGALGEGTSLLLGGH